MKTTRKYLSVLLTALFATTLCAHALGAEAAKSSAKAAKDPAAWKSLFDGKTLKGWKVADFGSDSKVEVKDGAILMREGTMMSGIAYAGKDFPKIDYEVTLEGKRVAGSDFFCTTTFPVGDASCSFVVGGWGGTVVGLSSIDYADASENQTNKFKEFKNDQWYRVRIRVSKAKIETWIDNEKLVDLATKDHKISIRFECEPCKPFGVCTWSTSGAVRDLRVRALTEAEKQEAAKSAEEKE